MKTNDCREQSLVPVRGSEAPVVYEPVDSVFDCLFGSPFFTPARSRFVPPVEVLENDDEILVRVELPGVEAKDVATTLEDGVLTIKGEKRSSREAAEDMCYCSERGYGVFERAVDIPSSVDTTKLSAQLRNGVLEVLLPKREEAKPRTVKVEVK